MLPAPVERRSRGNDVGDDALALMSNFASGSIRETTDDDSLFEFVFVLPFPVTIGLNDDVEELVGRLEPIVGSFGQLLQIDVPALECPVR